MDRFVAATGSLDGLHTPSPTPPLNLVACSQLGEFVDTADLIAGFEKVKNGGSLCIVVYNFSVDTPAIVCVGRSEERRFTLNTSSIQVQYTSGTGLVQVRYAFDTGSI